MSVSTARVHAFRSRVRRGLSVVQFETDEADLIETLICGGLLRRADADDKAAIAAALGEQMAVWSWIARHNPSLLRILSLTAA